MVLVTDGNQSYVLLSYGEIRWGEFTVINFSGRNGNNRLSFNIPGEALDAGFNSNVGIPGLHIYRVDQERLIEPTFNSAGRR